MIIPCKVKESASILIYGQKEMSIIFCLFLVIWTIKFSAIYIFRICASHVNIQSLSGTCKSVFQLSDCRLEWRRRPLPQVKKNKKNMGGPSSSQYIHHAFKGIILSYSQCTMGNLADTTRIFSGGFIYSISFGHRDLS